MSNPQSHAVFLQRTYERAEGLRQAICLEPSVNFVLEPDELKSIWEVGGSAGLNNVLRRAAVHAKRVIVLSHIMPIVGSPDDAQVASYRQLLDLPEWFSESELSERGISDDDFSSSGIFCFLPYYNPVVQVPFDKEGYWEDEAANLSMLLSDDYLRHLLTEGQASTDDELRVFRFLLPSVANLPLETLLSLRVDHQDQFDRLNRAEHKLLKGMLGASSSSAAKAILMEVDSYVRDYKEQMQLIRHKHARSLSLMSLGLAALTVPVLLPVELYKVLAGVIGGFSFNDFIVEQFGIAEQKSRMKQDDMYFAALVHKESQRRAR